MTDREQEIEAMADPAYAASVLDDLEEAHVTIARLESERACLVAPEELRQWRDRAQAAEARLHAVVAVKDAMNQFARRTPSPQQTRAKTPREMVGLFAYDLDAALRLADGTAEDPDAPVGTDDGGIDDGSAAEHELDLIEQRKAEEPTKGDDPMSADHPFVGGFETDPMQPNICQICEQRHAEADAARLEAERACLIAPEELRQWRDCAEAAEARVRAIAETLKQAPRWDGDAVGRLSATSRWIAVHVVDAALRLAEGAGEMEGQAP